MKINVDLDESEELEHQFNIHSIPQNIFVNAEGIEIDRIVGYFPPEEFGKKVNDILNGINTIPDLEKRIIESPGNIEILSALSEKYDALGKFEDSQLLYEKILTLNPHSDFAEFNLAKLQLKIGDPDPLNEFIQNHQKSEYLSDAFSALIVHFRKNENSENVDNEVKILNQWVSAFSEDSNVLNAYAWRMSELELNLDHALKLAKKAVELSASDPFGQAMIIDTEAEILWKQGRVEEAVETIERSIQINPKDSYYQSQKKKFKSPPEIDPEV